MGGDLTVGDGAAGTAPQRSGPAAFGVALAVFFGCLALGGVMFGASSVLVARPVFASSAVCSVVLGALSHRWLQQGRARGPARPAGGVPVFLAIVLPALVLLAGLAAARQMPARPVSAALEQRFDGVQVPAVALSESYVLALRPSGAGGQGAGGQGADGQESVPVLSLVALPAEADVPALLVSWWVESSSGELRSGPVRVDLEATPTGYVVALPVGVAVAELAADLKTQGAGPVQCWRVRVRAEVAGAAPRVLSWRWSCR